MGVLLTFRRSLKNRFQSQNWSRFPVTLGVGDAFPLEPLGYRYSNGDVADHDVPNAVLGHWHRGTDYALPTGVTVNAALGGLCTFAEYSDLGYGRLVTIEGSRYKLRYAHLSEIHATLGAWVHAGDVIGLSGASGNVTGPHLHVEVYDKVLDRYVDPLR